MRKTVAVNRTLLDLIRRSSRRIRPLPAGTRTTGELPRAPRAVLFDVYGTLLIRIGEPAGSASRGEESLRTLIRRHGLGMSPPKLQRSLREAISREHARLRARGVAHPEIDIVRIWSGVVPSHRSAELRRMIVEYELALHPCWPMPGSRQAIWALRREGIKLGVVSNAQFYTPLFLAALLGGRLEELGFSPELCFYSWDHGWAKPGQDMFERAASALGRRGIGRGQVLLVGNDPLNDVAAGGRAGFMTAQVAVDRRSQEHAPPRLPTALPDAVLGRLADLPAIVARRKTGR